jgi:ACS family hexuronate transporter-like MFS transporter
VDPCAPLGYTALTDFRLPSICGHAMPVLPTDLSLPPRRPAWKWWICGLLLLATMLNYMDRLTLNLTGVQIMREFGLDERDYAQLESAFAFAFALGAIIFGWLADRWPVRWLYPAAVVGWSLAGFGTGLAETFTYLLACRALLGLFEAGNWPCALRTTQHILPPSERTLGNSILQSGAALGAIITPLIVVALVSLTGDWRPAFLAVGVVGLTWVLLWLPSVRRGDLDIARSPGGPSLVSILGWLVLLLAIDTAVHMGDMPSAPPLVARIADALQQYGITPLVVKILVTVLGVAGVFLWLRHATREDRHLPRRIFFFRFWAMVALVVAINTTWHYFRAWLPLFLQRQRGYSLTEAGLFSTAYYIATDVGSLTSGFVVLFLARAGMAVHWSRVTVFAVCAALTLLSFVVIALPAGPLLLATLLVIGFASLALFPIYYSFSQDLTVRHQGKVTGALGCINWLAMALLHELVGDSIRRTGNYAEGLAIAGLAPLVGFAVLMLLWRHTPPAPVRPLDESPAAPDERIQASAAREQYTARKP